MLTADLIRATLRQGSLSPRWVDPAKDPVRLLAESVLEVFDGAEGETVGAIKERIAALEAEHPDPKLVRGFCKLLWERCDIETAGPVPATELRTALFELAAQRWPVRPGGGEGFTAREALLAEVAARFELTPEAVDRDLFADRPDLQKIVRCDPPAAATLPHRYNLALAQACLLRAKEARVTFADLDNKRLRAILRAVKFHRLLVRAEQRGTELKLWIDGPLSLHKHTGRYGVQLGLLLPAIARADAWALEADVMWRRGTGKASPALLRLGHKSPLRDPEAGPSWHDRGVWESPEETKLRAAMKALDTEWKLKAATRIFDLGGRDLLTPDYQLVHPDGRVAWLEIFWTWRQRGLLERLERLKAHGPPNLIVAWARRGSVEGRVEAIDHPASYGFKGVISPRRLIELAEAVGA